MQFPLQQRADLLLLECAAPASSKCREITCRWGGISTCVKNEHMWKRSPLSTTGAAKQLFADVTRLDFHLIRATPGECQCRHSSTDIRMAQCENPLRVLLQLCSSVSSVPIVFTVSKISAGDKDISATMDNLTGSDCGSGGINSSKRTVYLFLCNTECAQSDACWSFIQPLCSQLMLCISDCHLTAYDKLFSFSYSVNTCMNTL